MVSGERLGPWVSCFFISCIF